jgi:hypothetical protein
VRPRVVADLAGRDRVVLATGQEAMDLNVE